MNAYKIDSYIYSCYLHVFICLYSTLFLQHPGSFWFHIESTDMHFVESISECFHFVKPIEIRVMPY